MYKTSAYIGLLVNSNIQRLRNQKQQKKVTLFSSTLTHSKCDAGNITFCDFVHVYWQKFHIQVAVIYTATMSYDAVTQSRPKVSISP